MVKNFKKLAVVNNGFVSLYIEYLKRICDDNNVLLDVFDIDDYKDVDFSQYDYVITDVLSVKGCVKVFHQHSVEYQISRAESWIYKIIYRLTHLKKIKEEFEYNTSYPKLVCVSNEVKHDLEKYYKITSDKLIVAHAGFVPPECDNNKNFKNCQLF